MAIAADTTAPRKIRRRELEASRKAFRASRRVRIASKRALLEG
ncbi:hypothetical protein [Alsobacter sp. SYSU BS001988]